MNAILTKNTKRGTKTMVGEVLQHGLGYITLAIVNSKGNKDIKRFKLSDYNVNLY